MLALRLKPPAHREAKVVPVQGLEGEIPQLKSQLIPNQREMDRTDVVDALIEISVVNQYGDRSSVNLINKESPGRHRLCPRLLQLLWELLMGIPAIRQRGS
uniref:ORFX n=1 Tax=Bottlenose dolphin astrovirus 1 TaxID=645425 RepID=F1D7Y7_9VIRU|nr:ORFX [Bottlenose dolphin astrovirus 1]